MEPLAPNFPSCRSGALPQKFYQIIRALCPRHAMPIWHFIPISTQAKKCEALTSNASMDNLSIEANCWGLMRPQSPYDSFKYEKLMSWSLNLKPTSPVSSTHTVYLSSFHLLHLVSQKQSYNYYFELQSTMLESWCLLQKHLLNGVPDSIIQHFLHSFSDL